MLSRGDETLIRLRRGQLLPCVDIFWYVLRVPRPIQQERKVLRREFSALIRGHVEYSGLSEEQIAEETKWSIKRVHRILTGATGLRAEDMPVLARVLRKPIADLYAEPPRKSS